MVQKQTIANQHANLPPTAAFMHALSLFSYVSFFGWTINFELLSISYSLQNKDIWLFDILEGIHVQIIKSYVSLFFAIPHDIYLQKNQFKRTIFVSFGRKGMRSLFLFRISPTDQRLRRSLDNRNGGNTMNNA